MNAPSLSAEPTDITQIGDVESRHASLMDELRAETPQPAGEVEEDGESRPAAAPPAVASPADSDALARREERRKRLDAFKLQERQSVDQKERQAYAEKQAARAKDAEDRIAALSGSTFDRAVLKDPLKVMRLMEAEGISADKVAEAIRESLTNPDIAASRAAREAVSPELAEERRARAALEARLNALEAERATERQSVAEQRFTDQFTRHVDAQAARAPLSAALLKHDRSEFLQMMHAAAERCPDGAGADALLDAVEDLLDTDVRAVATKYGAIFSPSTAAPTSRANEPRNGAVQPRTLSNSLVTERGSVVDEEDLARLPVEERVKRMLKSGL